MRLFLFQLGMLLCAFLAAQRPDQLYYQSKVMEENSFSLAPRLGNYDLSYIICNTGIDPDSVFIDTDEDGVIDLYDYEPDSDPFAAVTIHGITMDSDGDGCPDHLDPEVNSSPVLPIEHCVNSRPVCILEYPSTGMNNCIVSVSCPTLQVIYFDLLSASIRPDALPELNLIADMLNRYNQLHVTVVATLSISEGELDYSLSKNRALNTISYLMHQGVNSSQLQVGFKLPDLERQNLPPQHRHLNRSVELPIGNRF